MHKKKYHIAIPVAAVLLFLSLILFGLPVHAGRPEEDGKAVVFVLDASGSMKSNDPERLAIDSIAQFIYSLPTDYRVGFVAYNTDAVAREALVDSGARSRIMDAAGAVEYAGYSNAGTGMEQAVELLEKENAGSRHIVLLSDGEILMGGEEETESSASDYRSAVSRAQADGISIHVIGLGDEMEDTDNSIFAAAGETGGRTYYSPGARDIQEAIDSILDEELCIKQSTVAIVDADGEPEAVTAALPFAHASKVRVLLTSDAPIRNLNTNFQGDSANQANGEHYSLIEINRPSGDRLDISFEGTPGSQVRINIIPEYRVLPRAEAAYTDREPEAEGAAYYERTAEIAYTFYDADNENIRLWTEEYFDHNKLTVRSSAGEQELALEEGTLRTARAVEKADTEAVEIDYSRMPVNIIGSGTVRLEIEGPLPLPEEEPKPPYALYAACGALMLLAGAAILIHYLRRPRPLPLPPPEDKPEPSKYSYAGKLNLYITRSRSGYDIPPLSYNLFRLPAGKVISLQEVLESCNVRELFEGAEAIYFKPGAGRSLILTNNSDCTVMKSREILMKKKSYQLSVESKVDIAFEDEISELTLQYKDLKPSEMW